MRFDTPTLQGNLVRLEPLDGRHAADLALAVEENRSTFGFTRVPRRSAGRHSKDSCASQLQSRSLSAPSGGFS